MIDDSVIDELVMRGLGDWVMAAEVVSVVKERATLDQDEAIRSEAMACIRAVVERGLMIVGDVTDDGFAAWEATQQESLARAEAAFDALTGLPNLGEVCWLSNTPAGDEHARDKASDRP